MKYSRWDKIVEQFVFSAYAHAYAEFHYPRASQLAGEMGPVAGFSIGDIGDGLAVHMRQAPLTAQP